MNHYLSATPTDYKSRVVGINYPPYSSIMDSGRLIASITTI
jgi:hypothetical protein